LAGNVSAFIEPGYILEGTRPSGFCKVIVSVYKKTNT